MKQNNWFVQLLSSRVFWSSFQCLVWAGLAFEEFGSNPKSLYGWAMLLLLAISLVILGLDLRLRFLALTAKKDIGEPEAL